MPEAVKRVDLRYGSFACSIQGFDDPAGTLEIILRHLQKAVSDSPVLAEAGLLDDETAQAIVDDVHGGIGSGEVTMMPGLVILWDGDVQAPAEGPAPQREHAARPVSEPDTLTLDAEDDPNLDALRQALDAHEQKARDAEGPAPAGDTSMFDDQGEEDDGASGETVFDDEDEPAPASDGADEDELVLGSEAQEIAAESSSVLGEDGGAADAEDAGGGSGTMFDDDDDWDAGDEAEEDAPADEKPEGASMFDKADADGGDGSMFDDPDEDIGDPDDFGEDLGPPPDDLDDEPKTRMKGSFAAYARQFHVAGGTDVDDPDDGGDEDDFVVPDVSAADIAKAAKAESVPDLIAAAAASLAIVQGRMSFTRKDVLDEFDSIPGEHPRTPEAKIKGWGRLVRDGRIRATEDDLFSLAMAERDRHRDALNR